MKSAFIVIVAAMALVSLGEAASVIPGFTYLGSWGGDSNSVGIKTVSSYWISDSMSLFIDALTSCKSIGSGSQLLAIESQQEDDVINQLLLRSRHTEAWTSGAVSSGQWRWGSTKALVFVNWIDLPVATPGTALYVSAPDIFDYAWRSDSATMAMKPFICETPSD